MILCAMSETVRLYRYRTLLAGGRVRTRTEMLELLEISPATFKRDLTKLRDQMRMPIVFDREEGGYRMEVDSSMAELPGLWFSQNELLALATTKQMLEQLEPGFWGNRLQPLQDRLGELLEWHGIDPLELSRRVAVLNTGKRRFESNAFDAVSQANFTRCRVMVRHFGRQTGEVTERVISPQCLVYYRSNWYVDAWCHLRNDLRSFSIDAMESATLLSDEAVEVDPVKIHETFGRGYGIFGGAPVGRAKLKFSARRARWVAQEEWHPDQVSSVLPDGTLMLQVPYSDTRELIGEILRHGTDVEVIAPPDLREQAAATIDQMREAYAQR